MARREENEARQAARGGGHETGGGLERRGRRGTAAYWPSAPRDLFTASPFQMMRRISDEMDRVMEDMFRTFGMARRPAAPEAAFVAWSPPIEMFERDNQLVIRAELPGLKKEEVQIEVTEDAILIQGERRRETEQKEEGTYRSEWSYGHFYREVPLPEGIDPEKAKAHFDRGVLEITLPAPQQRQRRRIPVESVEVEQRKPEEVGAHSS